MSDNRKILNEAFFKKSKVADKMKKKYGYEPMDVRKDGQLGYGSIIDMDSGLPVTDTKEAGRRIVSALGASIGQNSVRNMASKSIKTFPIIISDQIEPETSVMIKRVMEEQYAEYLSLIISNEIIDISAFQTSGEEGNIAIQALDKLSPEDEGKALRRKAVKGDVSLDDMFANMSSYSLIRNENYRTGNAVLDNLLEGAIVTDAAGREPLFEFLVNNLDGLYDGYENINESSGVENTPTPTRFVTLDKFIELSSNTDERSVEKKIDAFNKARGMYTDNSSATEEHRKWSIQHSFILVQINSIKTQITALEGIRDGNSFSNFSTDIDAVEAEIYRLEQDISNPEYASLRHTFLRQLNRHQNYLSELEVKYENARPTIINARIRDLKRELRNLENEEKQLQMNKPDPKREERKYNRLTTPSVLLDPTQLKDSMDSSIGEILLNTDNVFIRERFEKATFLLEAHKISGLEYIEYLISRLGIPVSQKVRQHLVLKYKVRDIIDSNTGLQSVITAADAKRISDNMKIHSFDKTLTQILKPTMRNVLVAVSGASVGAGVGAVVAGAGVLATSPLLLTILVPAIVGAGAGLLMSKLFSKKKKKISKKQSRLRGWERVEALIEDMEDQQNDLRKIQKQREQQRTFRSDYEDYENKALTGPELNEIINNYSEYISNIAKNVKAENTVLNASYENDLFDTELLNENTKLIEEFLAGNEEHTQALLEYNTLQEAKVQTTIPVELELKYEYDTKKKPDVLVTPKFATRSQYAYGSVEYDKRELKDRRYNAPLLMKVNFKERFSDGTFSDNELTAVIGILGVITRVPSEEMEYILNSNAEGNTLHGIFEPEGDPKKLISNLLGIDKIKSDVKNLPQSADVWKNLEKISRLAISNSLSGRKSNNIANAHIIFAQKEIDNVRADSNVDYLKQTKLVSSLMKRYSAFTIMIANDVSERLYIFDDPKSISWDVIPYSSYRNKDTGDQLNAMLTKMSSGRL